jgi:signal transduction histidine kinase
VLIVDDEAAQLKALLDTLPQHGYAVVGASSGEDAVAALHGQSFDLVLTDLRLPGMDGIALLRTALSIDPNIVGVLMTGHGTIASAVEALQAGALDYILKPFKLSAALPVLARAVTVRRLRLENAELEQRVKERSSQLEDANRELDAFAFSVSHDLRAPLRAVTGYAGILLHDHGAGLPSEARALVERIVKAGQHGEHLVEELLRFSRLGRQALVKRPVDLEALLQEVIGELRAREPHRRVDVHIGPLPEVVADPALLRQVLENLVANAFKFTAGRDPATVDIGCDASSRARVFFVRDNGVGFDMRFATRLFGVFQRLHTQEQFAGTGAGLSLVQRIVHRHGGEIWAEAAVDRGATFFFTLGE